MVFAFDAFFCSGVRVEANLLVKVGYRCFGFVCVCVCVSQFSLLGWTVVGSVWCFSVTFSRIYLGVHS